MNAELDKVLADGIEQGAAPGAVAIVVNRDGVVWEGAAGERASGSGSQMTTDTFCQNLIDNPTRLYEPSL